MAAVSAWGKPGAWALESEEQDAAAALESQSKDKGYSSSDSHQSQDFPSLSLAATTKIPKKKKKQTLSLAEFNSAGSGSATPTRAFTEEVFNLPTGPRERSAEELERGRGFGRRGEDSVNRWEKNSGSRVSERGPPRESRDMGPSRADEVDDWGKTKKTVGFERRERTGGFFDSQSRADESDSWVSKKGAAPPVMGERRERRGYDLFNKDGGGADSESWGRRREENGSGSGSGSGSGGRPRIVLQPRTLPIVNGNGGNENEEEKRSLEVKKGANPFGQARPREEVLKEKGKDWKEIDEKLEAVKIQEVGVSDGRKGFRTGKEDRTERAWRKPEAVLEANEAATPGPRADSLEEKFPEN